METTLFATIVAEAPVITADDVVDQVAELVILDDSKLRQVGGGMVMVVNF
jgi:hypothetical protein